MGSKCSCTALQPELQPNRNTDSTISPTSQNRRFSIPQSPLRISQVFLVQAPYERIDSKEFKSFELTENDTIHTSDTTLLNAKKSDDIAPIYSGTHEIIDRLISGYIRNTVKEDIDEIKLLSMIKNICNQYHNCYALLNDSNRYICSVILSTFTEEKVLLNLLSEHWKIETLRSPIIHLELLFRATRDSINNLHKICNEHKTLFVFQSVDNEIFGAFTSIPYTNATQSVSKYYDKDAFLWNLKNKKIFGINSECINKENIFHYSEEDEILIHFGNGPDLVIERKCLIQNVNHSVPQTFVFNIDELIGSKHQNGYFTIKEIEIFAVYGV